MSSQRVPIERVLAAYAEHGELSNRELFEQLSLDLGLEKTYVAERKPVGRSGAKHNLYERHVRWHQHNRV